MLKILKKLLVAILFIVAIPVVLLLLYILFNLNLFHSTKKLSATELNNYVQHIDPVQSDPFKFVADKFDDHSIVFIGENHKRKQDLDFLNQLIPYLYQTKKINIIGWEFGAQEYQRDADSVVTASEFDRRKAISVMRRSMFYWCWEEYLNIFKTIWQVNKGISKEEDKIKFLQLNTTYVSKLWNSTHHEAQVKERTKNFDNILPSIIEKVVIQKNKKILIYCGLHHSMTKFKTPKAFFIKNNELRAGQILYAKYPDKIFQIDLVSPFPERWSIYKDLSHRDIKFVYPFEAVFNQIYDTLKIPFAINSNNPYFSNIKDYSSFYEFDKWGGVKLKDFCDGCIMLQSFDKIEPAHFIKDWVTTQEDLNEVKNTLPEVDAKKIKTIADLMNYINPNLDIDGVKKYHNMKKFW
jgi:hypothetical protein